MTNPKNNNDGWVTVDRSAKRKGRPKEVVEAEYAARVEEEKKQQQQTYHRGSGPSSSSRPSTSSSSQHPKPNSNTVYTSKDLFKKLIDDEPDDFHLARVPREISLKIQQARQNKNMSQKDLALAINEKISVVVDYEKGSAIPNNLILMKMESALGVKLIKK